MTFKPSGNKTPLGPTGGVFSPLWNVGVLSWQALLSTFRKFIGNLHGPILLVRADGGLRLVARFSTTCSEDRVNNPSPFTMTRFAHVRDVQHWTCQSSAQLVM